MVDSVPSLMNSSTSQHLTRQKIVQEKTQSAQKPESNSKNTIYEQSSSDEEDEEIRDRAREYYRKLLQRREWNKSIREDTEPRETAQMNRNVQQPQNGEKVYRNTGFPEPFSHERNTTLPHPDADTSANPTIEAPDFNLTRTHSRRSMIHGGKQSHSFRHPLGGSRSSSRQGPTMGGDLAGLYDNIQYADGTRETKDKSEIEREVESREDLITPPDTRRERKPNDSGIDMNANGIGEKENDDEGYNIADKKKGLLKKLGLTN